MDTQPASQRAERDWRRLTDEFRSESDRAAALVAAAVLDHNLEHLLRAYMVRDQREVETLLGGSLQGFGGRIRAAYCLGLVSHDEAADLRAIQNVRNYFAHNLYASFAATAIAEQCGALRLAHRLLPESTGLEPRRLLEATACMLSVLLVRRTRQVASRHVQRRAELENAELGDQCPFLVQGQVGMGLGCADPGRAGDESVGGSTRAPGKPEG